VNQHHRALAELVALVGVYGTLPAFYQVTGAYASRPKHPEPSYIVATESMNTVVTDPDDFRL